MAKTPETPKTPRQALNAGRKAGNEYVIAHRPPENVNFSNLRYTPSGDTSGTETGSGTPSSPQNVIVNDGSAQQQNNIHQNTPQTEQTTNDLNVDEAKKDEKDMSVDELKKLKEKATDPAEQERIQSLIDSKNNSNAPVGGEIGNTPNPDEDQLDDEDKFDIQQGDFIDFLMKEVVLASAAWAGKKTFKTAGYWALYKPLSLGYHSVMDPIEEKWDTHKAKKDAEKKAQAVRDEILRQHGNGALSPDDVPSGHPQANNAKDIIKLHNKELKQAHSQVSSANAFSEYIDAFAAGNLEERLEEKDGKQYWKSKDGTLLALDTPIVDKTTEDLLEAKKTIDQNPSLSEKQKHEAFNEIVHGTSAIMLEKYSLQANADLFAVNYATAKQLQSLADGKDPQDRNELINEARTLYYTAHVAEHVGNKELLSTELLSKEAENARDAAFYQIKENNGSHNPQLIELDKQKSINPTTGIFTEERYNNDLTSQLKHDVAIENLKSLDEQAKAYIQLKTNQIKEDDFINNTGISPQDFANNHEKLAELINKQTERIDVIAPQGVNDPSRQELITKLQGAVKEISETEKKAEIFALNYSFANQAKDGNTDNNAELKAQGRQIYYATAQKDKQEAQKLSENGNLAAQEARNHPNQENRYLQQIQNQHIENKKSSNRAKQSLVDAACAPYEEVFETKRQDAERNLESCLANLDKDPRSYLRRKFEVEKRLEAIRGTKKTTKTQNPHYNHMHGGR